MDFNSFIGKSTGFRRIEYTWRDVALYALAVGAEEDEKMYFYEKNMKTLPSFGVVPYWNAINNYPQRPEPAPASKMIDIALSRELGHKAPGMHMEHELIMYRPIDPIKGSLVFDDVITNIYDRGEGKGIVVKTNQPIYDEAGNLICENVSSTMFFDGGGFGGEPMPKSNVVIPKDKEPDFIERSYISKTQNFLYRLTGDTNRGHVDVDEMPKGTGYDKPFMQGLCSFGFATRMAIKAIIPNQPERMTRVGVQMRNVCWPGSEVEFRGWKNGEGCVVFQLISTAEGKAILDRGIFEYK